MHKVLVDRLADFDSQSIGQGFESPILQKQKTVLVDGFFVSIRRIGDSNRSIVPSAERGLAAGMR
jgi:hypothetical protein